MGAGNQFLLLMWKNWLLQKRKVVVTILEIGVPVIFAIIMFAVRQLVVSVAVPQPTYWAPFGVNQLPGNLRPPSAIGGRGGEWYLSFAPNNSAATQVVDEVVQMLKLDPNRTIGFLTEADLVSFMGSMSGTTALDCLTGIVFTNTFLNSGQDFDNQISYRIRFRSEQYFSGGSTIRFSSSSDWNTDFVFPSSPNVGPRQNSSFDGGTPGYQREGFLAIQRALDASILQYINGSAAAEANVSLELRRFPFPPYIDDYFIVVLQMQLPLVILLSFIATAPNITKDIVLEKEKKLKESMKMMGLNNWLHWTAWFIKYFLFLLISVFFMTLFFHIKTSKGAVINYTDPSITFVYLLLYSITTIIFCFAVSVFFSKANSGAAAGGILFLATYVPYFFISYQYWTMSTGQKIASSLFHNVAMAYGCFVMSLYESTGVGLQWHNFYSPVSSDDNFTMAHVFLMLIIDCIFYGLITWYVDAIFPGDYGIPKPPYFPFTRSYWCGTRSTSKVNVLNEQKDGQRLEDDADSKNNFVEPVYGNAEPGVKIRNLRKQFGRGENVKIAVSDLNLNIYESQITALLGHNGAGKTTTMFMLTGFIPPTSGTAIVNGLDIRTEIDSVRKELGLCPQHDILFDSLTVKEHLTFFAKLKGLTKTMLAFEVDRMIEVLNLEAKTNVRAANLSGGMKRKLSVGIALIGGSKTIILDEPTSGMDPDARRQMWDILQKERKGRTMILSTHFMDEADYLGDRIAIMAEGVLQCCGSSLFLKSKYGVGYHMVMVKEPKCDVQRVTDIVQKHVPESRLESNISSELSYVLPSQCSNKFEALFLYLEENKSMLGISSYGASVTTMEEVFLRVGEACDKSLESRLQTATQNGVAIENGVTLSNGAATHNGSVVQNGASATVEDVTNIASRHTARISSVSVHMQPNGYQNHSYDDIVDEKQPPTPTTTSFTVIPECQPQISTVLGVNYRRNAGMTLYVQQFFAMFLKRIIHSWRNVLVSVTQLVIPLGFAAIGCVILITIPGPRDPPPMLLTFHGFLQPIAPYALLAPGMENVVSELGNAYQQFLAPQVHDVPLINNIAGYQNDPDMLRYLVALGESDLEKYNNAYMVAATFDGNSTSDNTRVTGFFNNQAYHTPAIALNVFGNTMLRNFAGSQYSISATNFPLPRATNVAIQESIDTQFLISFIISYNICFGMAFLVGTFVVFLIKERNIKSKLIQFVSGVHVANFWVSTFLWDFINFLIPSALILGIFAAFNVEAYSGPSNTGYLFLIFLMYGWAVLPFVYVLSFVFSESSTGYVWVTILNIFTGTAAVLVVFMLKNYDLGTYDIGVAIEWVFYILLPNYCFGNSLQNLYTNHETIAACQKLADMVNGDMGTACRLVQLLNQTNPCCKDNCGTNCATYQENYLSWDLPGCGRGLVFMAIQGVVCFTILFFMESETIRRCWQKVVEGTVTSQPHLADDEEADKIEMNSVEEDSDVRAERTRILTQTLTGQPCNGDSLVLYELRKYYGSFLAVDRLSVGISQGECFGLLGINGAGKTSTFKMLTGDETVSSGEAYLDGHRVTANIKQVQQRLGYCPQFDALIDQMTVSETLWMYSRLRGVNEADIKEVVDKIINDLLLEQYANKQAGKLSGGNKRKLSTAIALVGDPPVIFLDEPTTGMDPVARRLLWNTLSKIRESGRTLVLTSHSMEECEALCTRIAIMVNGQFKCLGGIQHLKNKFGEGYTLVAKVAPTAERDLQQQTKALMDHIEKTFEGSTLKDLHQGLVHYEVNNDNGKVSWAKLFSTMEKAKAQFNIEDYSVSQTTLEQVFLNFARAQRPPLEDSMTCAVKCCNCCRFFFGCSKTRCCCK